MSEQNKELVRRWQQAYNTGELDVLDDILDPGWATNAWPPGMPQSVAAAKQFGSGMLAALPDYHCRIDELVAEGDQVLMRWTASFTHVVEIMGAPPTGRLIESGGMNLFRIAGGRIVSHWAYATELTSLADIGAAVPAEWALAQHHPRQTRALTDTERVRMQRETVAEHCRAENVKDWAAVHDTFVQDETAGWDAVPMSARIPGLAGVRDFYASFDAALPDFTVTLTSQHDVPGVSVIEATVSGTHKGEFCGIPGSGRHVTFELAAFFVFGDGDNASKIVRERAYWDNETILRQMRGEADAPTGIGLAREADI